MTAQGLRHELAQVGRRVAGWRARRRLWAGFALVIGSVAILSGLDLYLRYGRVGRWMLWLLLVGGVSSTFAWAARTMSHRLNALAVAAMAEKSFPHLDNHLINFLLFSADTRSDAFKQAYVSRGVPEWRKVDIRELNNRRLQRRSFLALVSMLVLLALPGAFLGRAWGDAVMRVVNPFANIEPVSLTHILKVEPGNAEVLQGSAVVLTAQVQGVSGHQVRLELDPSDGEQVTHALGKIREPEAQAFSYRLPKVNSDFRYRFRAGDAVRPEWYQITTRPPVSFSRLAVTVKPPEYTGLEQQQVDGLSEHLTVPLGSELTVEVGANLPLRWMRMARGAGESEELRPSGKDPVVYSTGFQVMDDTPAEFAIEAVAGDRSSQWLRFALEPDRTAEIKVISPQGQPVLSPGANPSISFEVSDDFGLSMVGIEEVDVTRKKDKARILDTWRMEGRRTFTKTWEDTRWKSRDDHTFAYRIIAMDNCPFDKDRRTVKSGLISFNRINALEAAAQRQKLQKRAETALSELMDMQRRNIARTRAFKNALARQTLRDNWLELAERQVEIRAASKTLLENPLNPLGNLSGTMKQLYINEMLEVISVLQGVPDAAPAEREARAEKGLALEEKILRQLSFSEVAMGKARLNQSASALASVLKEMIRKEAEIIKQTAASASAGGNVAGALVDRQDDVAMDLTDFIKLCRSESAQSIVNDETFGKLLAEVADSCESDKIRDDMMLASEQLDGNQPAKALPYETSAKTKLERLLARLDEVAMKKDLEEQYDAIQELEDARRRFRKIEEVLKDAKESMDMVYDSKDKDDKDVDMMEEAFKELAKKLQESVLEVPTDLNIFMELNVANDLVEDVFQIFEEIDSEKNDQAAEDKGLVNEIAAAKAEGLLEGMEEAQDRIDNMEGWLRDMAENTKRTAEAFDKEEMPDAGMSLGALKTEAEDIIGDLLDENKEMAQEADDGAINHAVSDTMANNEIAEGEIASFGAQGKSGNETPDHKEQDGRSNVGRQGMATGETAAGSGTMNEGDHNIEERRTQEPTSSGQIDLDGEPENVDTKATGGGKQATGKADDFGMEGGAKRMDATEQGSAEGLSSLMKEKVDTMYAKASMQNVRVDSLQTAAHFMKQAEDAVAKGNIAQMKEFHRLAAGALKRAQADLDAALTGSFEVKRNARLLEGVVDGGSDAAPPEYRDMVAQYYKALNENM